MQKNLILAVVLSSLVYIGWYSVMEKRIQPPNTQAAQQAQTALQAQAGQASQGLASQAAPAALPENWKQEAVTLKAGKAEYSFNPGAAAQYTPWMAVASGAAAWARSKSRSAP